METECVEWAGAYTTDGYGRSGRTLAHRQAWEQNIGAIPAGFVIHHRCRNKACVNLEHLEALPKLEHDRLHPVPPEIGRLGGLVRGKQNRDKTHCPQGHAYTPENTYVYSNGRTCKTCAIERTRQRRQARGGDRES